MMTDDKTNWRKVCAIQETIPSPLGVNAAGKPIQARNANSMWVIATERTLAVLGVHTIAGAGDCC